MFFRPQNYYLLASLVLSCVCLFCTVGEWLTETTQSVAYFTCFTFGAEGELKSLDNMSGPFCLGILLIVVILLTAVTLMLHNFRMRQLRLTIFSTILLLGWVASYALFAYKYDLNIEQVAAAAKIAAPEFKLRFMALLPAFSAILNCMAIHGIRMDEAVVRSLDRIR